MLGMQEEFRMKPLAHFWISHYKNKADKYASRNVVESQKALTAWLDAWYRMRDIHFGN